MSHSIVTGGAKAADIDVLACVVAYAELLTLEGKHGIPVIAGSFTMSVTPSILEWGAKHEKEHNTQADDNFVLVDISDPEHVPAFVAIDQVTEVYDHRAGHEDFWTQKLGSNSHIEMVGACGTLIWEEFKKRNHRQNISNIAAKLLLASIVSNTLNFRGPITTERDRLAYAELKEITGITDEWVSAYFLEQENVLFADFKNYLKADMKTFETSFGEIAVGQLELWDVGTSIQARTSEIDEAMREYSPRPWIVNIPNISKGYNYIYSSNTQGQRIVEEKLHVRFTNNFARTERLMMRKEVMKVLLAP